MFQHVVIQGIDHSPNRFHIFCQVHYLSWSRIHFRWTDIHSCSCDRLSLPSHHSIIHAYRVANVYHWGIKLSAPLPSAYVLPKAKKQFLVGRPIISFFQTCFAKLWRRRTCFEQYHKPSFWLNIGNQPAMLQIQRLHKALHSLQHDRDYVWSIRTSRVFH